MSSTTMLTETTQQAKQALQQFLKTLLGHDFPLALKDPTEVAPQDLPLQSFGVTAFSAEHGALILLDEAWVALLSEAMLGEAMQPSDDGARDLMEELTGQGYGAVRNALAESAVQPPDLRFEVTFQTQDLDLPDALTLIPFMAEEGDAALRGVVAFPPGAIPAAADTDPPAEASSQDPGAEKDEPATSEPEAETEDSVDVAPASFSELGKENVGGDGAPENFDLLAGVELEVTVELGRRRLPLADVLRLTTGSVIELEKLVGEPLEIYANGQFIAEGEAVVIDEQFGVRITSIASRRKRNKAFF